MARRERVLTDEERDKALNLIRAGVHPEEAFVAIGVPRRSYYTYKARSRKGSPKWRELFRAIDQAQAQCESNDVVVTRRAVQSEPVEIECEHCGEVMRLDEAKALVVADQITSAQSVKSQAAAVAFQRLMLRFPKRWQARIVHEVSSQLDGFLDVAQRVLTGEVFEALLTAYVESQGDSETPALEEGQDRVH